MHNISWTINNIGNQPYYSNTKVFLNLKNLLLKSGILLVIKLKTIKKQPEIDDPNYKLPQTLTCVKWKIYMQPSRPFSTHEAWHVSLQKMEDTVTTESWLQNGQIASSWLYYLF